MKNRISRHISLGMLIIIFLLLWVNSCKGNDDFDSFKNAFPIIKSDSVVFDSLNLREMVIYGQYDRIDVHHEFMPFAFLSDSCPTQPMYEVNKYGRYDLYDKTVLIYMFNINKDCAVDGYDLLVVLAVHNEYGELIEQKTIGHLYEVFGLSIYKYSKVLIDGSTIIVDLKFREEVLDSNDVNQVSVSDERFIIR